MCPLLKYIFCIQKRILKPTPYMIRLVTVAVDGMSENFKGKSIYVCRYSAIVMHYTFFNTRYI